MSKDSNSCPHHWLIEPPKGATSWGKCSLCGKRREFSNIIEHEAWSHYRVMPQMGKGRHYIRHTVEEDNPGPEWENGIKVLER